MISLIVSVVRKCKTVSSSMSVTMQKEKVGQIAFCMHELFSKKRYSASNLLYASGLYIKVIPEITVELLCDYMMIKISRRMNV